MAGNFTAIDLSLLAAPDVVETIDYETILAAMLADLVARAPEFSALVESDPAYKILEVAAFREVILRQRANEAARAVMLPYALGADLDNLAALFGVVRLVVDPGDALAVPPIPPTYETDDALRRRTQLSLEGYSTAGPRGAYIYHALTASGDVLDANASSPSPGDVLVSVLSRTGNGTAAAPLLATVLAALDDEDVRPLCDHVVVASAGIVNYSVAATLTFFTGPDQAVVLASAQAAIEAYAEAQHRIGRDVTLSGIYAALHQPGVMRVDLTAPVANIAIGATQASFCTSITLTDGGIGE
ncbi:baseplate assembly protein [Fuscibacter oryzae]|uniref:Baseplate J/gp47 family protein n=1 Tax=Fuscibacter oryzae TaxID=2803939 RepID=A0A8J7SW54_9RHOB|nr:baseplate J/gp47 family protein [Fuscibacter oryzae]MBL4929326.1 baseplate J/gp47 family protein [Fuscibacter oryzae]